MESTSILSEDYNPFIFRTVEQQAEQRLFEEKAEARIQEAMILLKRKEDWQQRIAEADARLAELNNGAEPNQVDHISGDIFSPRRNGR